MSLGKRGLKRRSEARVVGGWQRRTEPPHGTGIRNTGNSRGPGSRGGGGGGGLSAEGGSERGGGSSSTRFAGERGLERVTSRGN